MSNKSAAHLKLHLEELPEGPLLAGGDDARLAPLLTAFAEATGWRLQVQGTTGLGEAWSMPLANPAGEPAPRLALHADRERLGIDLAAARPLAQAIGALLEETNQLRHALWQREAELAAGVPVSARPDDEPHLAERLESVLQGGASAVGCQAAALYLLDETTTELKLRALVGLPADRLLAPPRPLRGAMADLEALVGHAVVLEDTSLLPHWRCPEDFPAAVCVPVSSPTMPLGTLWMFCDEPRDFSPEQTNLIEIVAGRLAADLEREMLLAAGTEAKRNDRQLDLAERWQHDRLPSVAPLVEGFEVAGWTRQAAGIGGDFHDWQVLPDGRLSLVVGDAQGTLVEAGLNAAALHAAVRSHAAYAHDARQLLTKVNETLWTGSAGDQSAGLLYSLVCPETGVLELGRAGEGAAILLRGDDRPRELFLPQAPRLGLDLDARFSGEQRLLGPGDVLLLVSEGAAAITDEAGLRIGPETLAALLSRHQPESAAQLLARIRRLLERTGQRATSDATVLVLRRKPGRD
ncbi:MAG: SpoIIE family protein phosphatase [Pirellulaceae bacterium]|nr:SpoIIE family protein phosphatase [Pirellulaceae bacterium]